VTSNLCEAMDVMQKVLTDTYAATDKHQIAVDYALIHMLY